MNLVIHIDGGARGNPGPAGAGVVIHDDEGTAILEIGYFLGRMTNNVAEYSALIKALEASQEMGATQLLIHSDSELLVKQINGEYRVKNPGLQSLFDDAMAKLRTFSKWTVRHVRREGNARADELANLAMDAADDVSEIDTRGEARSAKKTRTSTKRNAKTSLKCDVTCTASPAHGVCTAPCAKGDRFEFGDATPEGVCLRVAVGVIDGVIAVQQGLDEASVSCKVPGCGGKFSITKKD